MKPTVIKFNSDYFGITASIACIIHCLIVPLFFILSGYANEEFHLELFGIDLDYVFVVIAVIPAYLSFRHTHRKLLKYLFAIGWLLFLSGVLLKDTNLHWVFMHIGSLTLISSHIYNIRLCNQERCEHDDHD